MSKPTFISIIEQIVSAAGLSERFTTDDHFHIRIANNGFMDLVIESWRSPEPELGKRRISVAHYYEQNGDLVPDPDVEINEQGEPINITLAPPGGYTQVRSCEGLHLKVNARADKDVREFLVMWATNLKDQGFVEVAQAIRQGGGGHD